MFKQIKFFIKQHKFEYLITFFVFTNLFPAWFPQFAYYIAFALILYKMSKFKMQSCGKTTLFYVFIAFCGYLQQSTWYSTYVWFYFLLYYSWLRQDYPLNGIYTKSSSCIAYFLDLE